MDILKSGSLLGTPLYVLTIAKRTHRQLEETCGHEMSLILSTWAVLQISRIFEAEFT